jgi:prepilin-type processing-associated H-X9-DG protein
VALLLPAIQAAREAARRAKCQSNMHNLGLAVLNYESTKKRFPTGFVASGPASSVESWGWSVFILPYLEEQSIYDRLRPSDSFIAPVDGTRKGARNLADVFVASNSNKDELVPLQTPLPVYRCPSDSTPDLIPVGNPVDPPASPPRSFDDGRWERHFNGANSPVGFQPSTANYIGNRGTIDAGCPWLNGAPNKDRCDSNGVFYANSTVATKQISDGTTKTFMLGERNKFCLAATWIGARNPVDGAEMWSSVWILGHARLKLNFPTTGAQDTCTETFASSHPGGAYFTFCDGSVRFINDDINFDDIGNNGACYASPASPSGPCKTQSGNAVIGVYQRLAWRNDGVQVDNGDF